MGAFDYKALDQRGRQKRGTLEGDSARLIRQQLREKGWTPLQVEPSTTRQNRTGPFWQRGASMSVAALALVTRQLATLIQAGLPIEEALSAVGAQTETARVRSIMLAVRSRVLEGFSLAESLADFPNAFPELYRSTVAAGEHAGHLDLVLNRLADYTEQRQASRQKIQLAAVYPIILSLVCVGIVAFLLGYVVPDIIRVFLNNGQALPTLTEMLLVLSDWTVNYGAYALIVAVVAAFAFRYAMRRPAFRLQVHRQMLHFPFLSGFVRGTNTARYASTLSILNSSGVPLVEAMRIAGEVLGNQYLKQKVAAAAQQVKEGASLHHSLEQTGYFPPMMIHMIASGEASGELGEMLERTATAQESDLQGRMATLVGLFEPFMLLFMGAVVLIIVMAIMLPILSMSNLVG